MGKAPTKRSDTRQRIVETAERLFYAEGLRAVGIDRIIAEARVAKMSLYHHFPSKDDLILAVLKHREEKVDAMFHHSIDRHVRHGMNRLEAFFAALKDWFESAGFRGCAFINAHVELADARHPASRFSTGQKGRFYEMLQSIIVDTAGLKAAKALTPAIALLVEGAIVTAVMQQSSGPAEVAKEGALALIAQAKRR